MIPKWLSVVHDIYDIRRKRSWGRIERMDTLQQVFVVAQKHDLRSDGGIDCARLLANHTTKAGPHTFRRSRSRRDGEKATSEESQAREFRLQRLPLNVWLWLWGVPWQERGSRAEPVCQFPLHIPLLLDFFLLFHLHVTIHVNSRKPTVVDMSSFLLRPFVLQVRRTRVIGTSRAVPAGGRADSASSAGGRLQLFDFLLQFLQLGEDIAMEWNKDRQHAIVWKELRHILEKERFHSVPLIRCQFHSAMHTPSTSKARWCMTEKREWIEHISVPWIQQRHQNMQNIGKRLLQSHSLVEMIIMHRLSKGCNRRRICRMRSKHLFHIKESTPICRRQHIVLTLEQLRDLS